MSIDIFYENWDGDIVLSDISNFDSQEQFLDQAQKYVDETRGYHVPVIKTNIETIKIVVNDEGEWYSKMVADEEGFEGKELTVYKVDLDWDSVHESSLKS